MGGGKLLYSHSPPPFCQGGIMAISGGGGIYYIAIFSPIQVRGRNGYGENWLYNTGLNPVVGFISLFFVFHGMRREVVVCFVDIDEIIDNHCQEFLFITLFKKKKT